MLDNVAALPVGAVIRDSRGWVWLRRPKGWQTPGRGGYTMTADLPQPVAGLREVV